CLRTGTPRAGRRRWRNGLSRVNPFQYNNIKLCAKTGPHLASASSRNRGPAAGQQARDFLMPTKLAVSLLAASIAVVFSKEAHAQRRRGLIDITPRSDRHGFWINLGVGAGKDRYKFADESGYPSWGDAITKPAFSLRLGGTVNPHLRLG